MEKYLQIRRMQLNLKNEILKEHSKSNTTRVAKWVNRDENI